VLRFSENEILHGVFSLTFAPESFTIFAKRRDARERVRALDPGPRRRADAGTAAGEPAGQAKPEDVTAALGGPLGQKTEHLSGVARPIRERYGRDGAAALGRRSPVYHMID